MPSHEKSSRKLIMEASLGMHGTLPQDYRPEEPYTQHAHEHPHDQPSSHQTGQERRYPWSTGPDGKPRHTHMHHYLPADGRVISIDLHHHQEDDRT